MTDFMPLDFVIFPDKDSTDESTAKSIIRSTMTRVCHRGVTILGIPRAMSRASAQPGPLPSRMAGDLHGAGTSFEGEVRSNIP